MFYEAMIRYDGIAAELRRQVTLGKGVKPRRLADNIVHIRRRARGNAP